MVSIQQCIWVMIITECKDSPVFTIHKSPNEHKIIPNEHFSF